MNKHKWKDLGVTIFIWLFFIALFGGVLGSVIIMFSEMVDKAKDGPDISYMDVNLDGQVDDMDARLVYDVLHMDRIPTPDLLNRCDVDEDGWVTEDDAYMIHKEVFK